MGVRWLVGVLVVAAVLVPGTAAAVRPGILREGSATAGTAAVRPGILGEGSATAGTAAVGPGIVGGGAVDVADAPWMVALIDQYGYPFCGGSLISPTIVVTAAHCLAGRTAGGMLVLGGRPDLSQITKGDSVSGVSSIAVESGFLAAQRGGDIAELRLVDAFPYRPLKVANKDAYRAGTMGTVLGWGRVAQGGPANTMLREVRVPIVDQQRCAQLYGQVISGDGYDSDAMFCAGYTTPPGDQGYDACQGDAGGPLVVDGQLAGIVSWGIGCGHYPSFYTKVATYLTPTASR
jgi:secreted trypsin-like serine protease